MRGQFGSDVRFVMMNSFSTSDDTKAHLSSTHPDLVATDGWELVQNKSPKVDAATMEPVSYPENPSMEWCGFICNIQSVRFPREYLFWLQSLHTVYATTPYSNHSFNLDHRARRYACAAAA
jgi:hypothetical protein